MTAEIDAVVRDLVARRHGLGLSQREVARRAGIANGTLSELEQGQHSPVLSTLRAWARALDCDVVLTRPSRADYLRDGSPEAVALVREARGLPPLPIDKENPMPTDDNGRTDAALAEVERQIVNLGDTQSRGIFDRTTLTACADLVAEMRRKCAESARG